MYVLPVLLTAAALAYGYLQLSGAGLSSHSVRVGALAVDTEPVPREDVWPVYQAGLGRLVAQGAQFVVLPEKIAPVDAAQWKAVQESLSSSAITVDRRHAPRRRQTTKHRFGVWIARYAHL